MIRKYYSAWIPGWQEKLTATLREAFAETPRPGEDKRHRHARRESQVTSSHLYSL